MEIIRFGLLLTMTVALISVATRYDDSSGGHNQAARGHHPASTTSSPSGGQAEAPSQGGSTSSPSPTTGGRGGHSDTSAGAGGNEAGAGNGSAAAGAPTLPRTGGTQAAELAALALLLIAAGSYGMRISRPRPVAGQPDGVVADVAHVGQARGSSESNRPGTA